MEVADRAEAAAFSGRCDDLRAACVNLGSYHVLAQLTRGFEDDLRALVRFAAGELAPFLKQLVDVRRITLDGRLVDAAGKLRVVVECTVGGFAQTFVLDGVVGLGDVAALCGAVWEKIAGVLPRVASELVDVARQGKAAVERFCDEIATGAHQLKDDVEVTAAQARRKVDEFDRATGRRLDEMTGGVLGEEARRLAEKRAQRGEAPGPVSAVDVVVDRAMEELAKPVLVVGPVAVVPGMGSGPVAVVPVSVPMLSPEPIQVPLPSRPQDVVELLAPALPLLVPRRFWR
jgi:hypothetical protein